MTILQPVLQPVLRPLLADPLAPGVGDSLTAAVKAMFASGEKGVMFDLTRAANLYTDSARTTLVTASGDGVGSCTDLSPNAKHASSIGSARPTWNSAGYATWDAFDDYLQTAAIDFSATDAVTVVVSIRRNSAASVRDVLELSSTTLNNGIFAVFAPDSAGSTNAVFYSRGTATTTSGLTMGSAPSTAVITGEGRISGPSTKVRVNGVDGTPSAGSQGTGNYGNYPLNIGARNGGASLFFDGRIYRLLVIGRALTTTERNLAERWAAQPVGIAIP